MKTSINLLKTTIAPAFIGMAVFMIQACNGAGTDTTRADSTPKMDDSKEVAEDRNDAKFNKDSTERDAQFLVNAAEINMEEIQIGKLAQKNGTMKSVKDLGKMLEAEHTKAQADLKALAAKKNISIPTSPTEDGQDAYKKLSEEKKGHDFDKSFADRMVDGHKGAIDKFEKASNNSGDADIKAFATSMLPHLRAHLDKSNAVQEECKNMKM